MLTKIAASVEARRPVIAVKELYRGIDITARIRPEHLVAIGVEACLQYVSPAAVFVPTHGGSTARSIARFRFPVWTIAVSSQKSTCQQLQFSSGVYPIFEPEHPEQWKPYVRRWISEFAMTGEIAVLTEGPSTKYPQTNHRMEIIDLRR
jgi:pyruvate kinase